MLSCTSLLSFSFIYRITDGLWNITSALYLYSTPGPAEVTRTTGTSPSSGVVGNLKPSLLMTQTQDNHVKILFRYYSSVLNQWTAENTWAKVIDAEKGLYKLDSIPFYGPLVASDDIIFAEHDDDEGRLTYRRTVENSGNSVVNVVIMDKTSDINNIRDIFNQLGCLSERVNEGYFSMEVSAGNDYGPIKNKLIELEDKGIIGYAEPSLSDNHRAQT